MLEIGLTKDDISLHISEEAEENGIFASLAQAPAEKTKLLESTNREQDRLSSPALSLYVDHFQMCSEESGGPLTLCSQSHSCEEGKWLPLVHSTVKILLPIFPELLAKLTKIWSNCLYSNNSPILVTVSFD